MARHRNRARVLDGAGPARRPGRWRLPAGRSRQTRRHCGRDAFAGALGPQRRFARSHASFSGIPQRDHRADGQRACATRRTHRHQPYFAELRDVPVRVRTGRPTGRRPSGAIVARILDLLLAVVAVRDAVPLEHEISTRLGASLRLLRGRSDDPPGGRRLGDRRGLPGAAVHSAQGTAHRASPVGAADAVGERAFAPRRLGTGRRRVAADRSGSRRERRPPAARTDASPAVQAKDAAEQRR